MKYQAILSHCTGRVETLNFSDAGEARVSFADSRMVPFYHGGFLRSVSETGVAVTLERFTRH